MGSVPGGGGRPGRRPAAVEEEAPCAEAHTHRHGEEAEGEPQSLGGGGRTRHRTKLFTKKKKQVITLRKNFKRLSGFFCLKLKIRQS